MFSSLKNHPFPVEAFFENSLVLTYAIPKDELKDFIPECLSLDTFDDKWAFLAVAVVKTKNLRPKGFPEFMGNDFILIGYRIFVKYVTSKGKRLRGLYILKSETDKSKMALMGNIFTHYNYSKTDIKIETAKSEMKIKSATSDLNLWVNIDERASLPDHSPFKDWKEARRFAGPLPHTFTYDPAKKQVLIIEGLRENWQPLPVEVKEEYAGFIKKMNFKECVLANAFLVSNIPYEWAKGKTDQWIQQ